MSTEMHLHYDPEADIAYIYLADPEMGRIHETIPLAQTVMLDLDDQARLRGLEIRCASQYLPPDLLGQATRLDSENPPSNPGVPPAKSVLNVSRVVLIRDGKIATIPVDTQRTRVFRIPQSISMKGETPEQTAVRVCSDIGVSGTVVRLLYEQSSTHECARTFLVTGTEEVSCVVQWVAPLELLKGREGSSVAQWLPQVREELGVPWRGAPAEFHLQGVEALRAQLWMGEHDRVHGPDAGSIGGRYTFSFTPTSMGTGVSVRCACSQTAQFAANRNAEEDAPGECDVTAYAYW